MLLLTDGTVLVQGGLAQGGIGPTSVWYHLMPDNTGNYWDGTWPNSSSMNTARDLYGSVVLPSDQILVVGGQGSGGSSTNHTGEIFDPSTNVWTALSYSFGENPGNPTPVNFGDSTLEVLPNNGKVLGGANDTPATYLYDPANGASGWNAAGSKLNGDKSGEENWVKLPDGSILT